MSKRRQLVIRTLCILSGPPLVAGCDAILSAMGMMAGPFGSVALVGIVVGAALSLVFVDLRDGSVDHGSES